ncbi:energy-coupling factor transporter transmembrane component T family protein [Desulfatitalea alkaliphila]|uniref:Energy-coupling factor transporter transmembrane protein EcfT n=1 Tax=Desulfatitalea alkaliphila TaxID=2929485 RepID=A0AA41R561_9BACT|nr:energy-coupling factor transporter transmembrane component T [Desulfatitalea alkaliphila]MCJ8502524.1 energy-coupling factor transporter transmembrane protein EcfT [Desulfatitalea alkaliphila]
MAELSAFGFRQRLTVLHALDARVKLAALMALSTAALAAGPTGLVPATVLAAGAFYQTGVTPLRAAAEMRYFLLLLAMVWLARGLSSPGDPLITWGGFAVTHQGLAAGGLLCWRWLLIALLGLSLCATTRSAHIRAAVAWFLRPLPGPTAHQVGTMIGLLLRFIPVILTQAKETTDALRARAIKNRRNPLRRLRYMTLPLLRRTFLTADRLALAMAARSFGDRRTPHPWQMNYRDWAALITVGTVCAVMISV